MSKHPIKGINYHCSSNPTNRGPGTGNNKSIILPINKDHVKIRHY